jgi:peptidoglycan/LPS O-acetylase OafA/YrhL
MYATKVHCQQQSTKTCPRTVLHVVTDARIRHVSQSYRPDIDGLHALSVLAVMQCHAGFKAFTGGFIGVDVFFTISGFVVTTSLLGGLDRDAFSFRGFYARRAKRLAPSLYVMLLATFVFGQLALFPEDTFHLAKNILAVSTSHLSSMRRFDRC